MNGEFLLLNRNERRIHANKSGKVDSLVECAPYYLTNVFKLRAGVMTEFQHLYTCPPHVIAPERVLHKVFEERQQKILSLQHCTRNCVVCQKLIASVALIINAPLVDEVASNVNNNVVISGTFLLVLPEVHNASRFGIT